MGHLAWMHAAASKLDGKEAPCPECGKGQVEWKLVGHPVTRIGYAILWCPVCGRGTNISRMTFREGIDFAAIDDPVAATEGVPRNIRWIDGD